MNAVLILTQVKQLSSSFENGMGDITKRLGVLDSRKQPALRRAVDEAQSSSTFSNSRWKMQIKEATKFIEVILKRIGCSFILPFAFRKY